MNPTPRPGTHEGQRAFFEKDGIVIYQGDCLAVMASLPEASVDSIVTDPPYGLEFMGKEWDRIGDIGKMSHAGPSPLSDDPSPFARTRVAYSGSANVKCATCRRWRWDHEGRKCDCGPLAKWPNVKALEGARMEDWHGAWARAALRVAKPGAHLVAFGGTRTFHRLTCGIEDAGWEIRDCLSWLYGSGFPKSLDISKAADKAAGIWRGRAGAVTIPDQPSKGTEYERTPKGDAVTAAAAAAAGWGTALKPAWEPCILARKPLDGTVAGNFGKHGTGGLNIDGCRIGTEQSGWGGRPNPNSYGGFSGPPGPPGRWPANVALDEEAARLLDEQVGDCPAGASLSGSEPSIPGYSGGLGRHAHESYGDSGGPSRFFYTAKASRSEREEGLENLAPARRTDGRGKEIENPRLRTSARRNDHPTVKPVDLMRWLVRLVTPPGGIVLDPFLGSGTTLVAARAEFFRGIGIEREERYCQIAKGRLSQGILPLGATA